MPRTLHEDRFRALVHRRLEPGETIVATARLWSARPTRLPALAARYRDDVVVTDRRLMVWECAWWSRRPRRRVLADRLDDLTVSNASRSTDQGKVVRVRIDHPARPSVMFDIATDPASQRFATALLGAHTTAQA